MFCELFSCLTHNVVRWTLLLKSYSFTHISISEWLFLYTQHKFCVCICVLVGNCLQNMQLHIKIICLWIGLIHVSSDSNISSEEQLTSAFKGFLRKDLSYKLHYKLLREIYNKTLKQQIWIIMEIIYISTCIYYDIYMSSNIKGEAP